MSGITHSSSPNRINDKGKPKGKGQRQVWKGSPEWLLKTSQFAKTKGASWSKGKGKTKGTCQGQRMYPWCRDPIIPLTLHPVYQATRTVKAHHLPAHHQPQQFAITTFATSLDVTKSIVGWLPVMVLQGTATTGAVPALFTGILQCDWFGL